MLQLASDIDSERMLQFKGKWTSHPSTPSTPLGTPHPWSPRPKSKIWNLMPRRIALVAGGILAFFVLNNLLFPYSSHGVCTLFQTASGNILTGLCSPVVQHISRTRSITTQASSPTQLSSPQNHYRTATPTQSTPLQATSTATHATSHR